MAKNAFWSVYEMFIAIGYFKLFIIYFMSMVINLNFREILEFLQFEHHFFKFDFICICNTNSNLNTRCYLLKREIVIGFNLAERLLCPRSGRSYLLWFRPV
jgi:hypothetical protein